MAEQTQETLFVAIEPYCCRALLEKETDQTVSFTKEPCVCFRQGVRGTRV